MLAELVKFAKQKNYKEFEKSLDMNSINLDNKIEETSFFDLFENENIKCIVLRKLINSETNDFEKRMRILEKLIELKVNLNISNTEGKLFFTLVRMNK